MNELFIRAPKIMTWQIATGTIQICYIVSHKLHVSYPMRSGYREWHVITCGLKNEHQTYIICLKRDWMALWHHPSASLAVMMWKTMGRPTSTSQHDSPHVGFTTRTGWKV